MRASTSRQADRYNIDSLIVFGCCVGDGGSKEETRTQLQAENYLDTCLCMVEDEKKTGTII